jgi:MoaA/NifB/PqqE/SkfB family radical SAM enzyme
MDCSTQVEFGTSEHLARVFERACKARVPLRGAFDLTYRCNFRCLHCYVGHLVGQPASVNGELATEEVTSLLGAAADAGCLMMLLSGGEPLLRPDFLEIYAAAKRLGLIVTVFTNASLVSERHVQVFGDLPPHAVEVSVYGATQATYEGVTGVLGSFQRAQRGIHLLLEGGVNVVLKTMILQENAGEVAAIERWAEDLGVSFRLDPVITPRLDGDLGPLQQRVEPEAAVALEMAEPKRRKAVASLVERERSDGGIRTPPAERVFRCGAGLASFHIDPSGCLHPCLMTQGITFDARTMGFVPAWKAVASAVDAAVWEGIGGCAECSKSLLCGYCPGLFELEKTTAARPPDYLCRLGESRYTAIEADIEGVLGADTI